MLTDTWVDLKHPDNRRGHPVLLSVLFVFCPMAARWWLAGAEPSIPFDPLWSSLNMRASGLTLRQALENLGLGKLLRHARKYIEQVDTFRNLPLNSRTCAPELQPNFLGTRLSIKDRQGISPELNQIGGWKNFFPLVRSWAFSLRDWQDALGFKSAPILKPLKFRTRLFSFGPITLSGWRIQNYDKGAVCLIVPTEDFDTNWIPDIYLHALTEDTVEDVFLLSDNGQVIRASPKLGYEALESIINRVSKIAKEGSYYPAKALSDRSSCMRCGYNSLCWSEVNGQLTSLALELSDAGSHRMQQDIT